MAWYDESVFYHIYPIGLCGCPHENTKETESHFDIINTWTKHAKELGFNAVYIGPLFESFGHGYETTDYYKVDKRIGTNDDFKKYVATCHENDIKVIVDGVFNHVGREFFAFKDLQQNKEHSRYKDWFLDVNFYSNNEYNDGFSYQNWGGYNLMVKLNHYNSEVRDYIIDVVNFWIDEFDIDGIRLDAADVLNHDFMQQLRSFTNTKKADFWLMGEVIHGDYGQWVNPQKLHSVTNYALHKALYSGHNTHNYFEIAHTINRQIQLVGNTNLYNFEDNHDVTRIASKVDNQDFLYPIAMLLYTLPGIPSLYYGSEFALQAEKINGPDWNLRPALNLNEYDSTQPLPALIKKLGEIRTLYKELAYGEYKELLLTNRQYAFARILDGNAVICAVNNDDQPAHLDIGLPVQANHAIDLLHSHGINACKKQNDNMQQTLVSLEDNKNMLNTLQGLAHAMTDKINTDVDCSFEFGEYKNAIQVLSEKSNELIKTYEKESGNAEDEQETTNDDQDKAEEDTFVPQVIDINNNCVSIELQPNSGTIIFAGNN